MSLASPPDRASAPLLCLYGDGSRSAPRFDPPAGVEIVESDALTADEAVVDERLAGRDFVLLARGTALPPHAWERLVRAAAAAPAFTVLSPMGAGMALDARAWAVSDRAVVPTHGRSARLSYWRAVRTFAVHGVLDHLSIDDEDAPSLPAVVERARAADASLAAYPGLDDKPVLLHVLHGWGGGAQRFVEDLAQGDAARHHLVLMARGDSQSRRHGETLELYANLRQPPLRRWPLAAPIAHSAGTSPEYRAHFDTVLRDFGVGAVLVSSLIGHSLDALRSGLPTAVVTHDYYPLWPRLHADFGNAAADFSPGGIEAALRDVRDFEFAETRPEAWRSLRGAYVAALASANAVMIAPSRGVDRKSVV